jgi:hypothetical protein
MLGLSLVIWGHDKEMEKEVKGCYMYLSSIDGCILRRTLDR